MEAAVRWSPFASSERARFLLVDVMDQSVALHQITHWRRSAAGSTQLARCGRLPNFGAFDWSKSDESIVALGLVSGSACLVQLHDDGRPAATLATFKLRQQRKCNSIAVGAQDWLAVALDRTRSDACLNIFDTKAPPTAEPLRRLCPAEVVSSVRFSPTRPHELIVAAQRSFIRLYDLRDGDSGGAGSLQVATRHVHNIAVDPLDDHYFASAGSTGDPSVTVWDKRWIAQSSGSASGTAAAVFDFYPAVDDTAPATIWSLRYSGQQRGRLAMCSSRGELKVVDMTEGQTSILRGADYLPNNPLGGQPWTHNRYVSRVRTVRRAAPEHAESSIIAFDWISADPRAAAQDVLQLRPDRRVDIVRVPRAVAQAAMTARHDLSLAFDDLAIVEPKPKATSPHERTAQNFGPPVYQGESLQGQSEEAAALTCTVETPQLNQLLSCASVQRERCRRGYLFDCDKNMKIVSGHWQLERLWEIVDRFRQQAARNGMVAERQQLDLSYLGVAAICAEKMEHHRNRMLSLACGKLEDAVADLVASRGLPPFEGERTHYPEIRQLCLEMCGWKFHQEALEQECRELADRGLHYQAVVQAVLHERKHIALNLLRSLIRSKTIPNIGLGALLAADTINEEQREMCLWMTTDTDDPALKALLAFLKAGDWRDVMKTNYLHLGYRVALGLKYLNDTELRGFIQSETARAIKNGDLEGILLTGLGEQCMGLFQTYITKTNDLQTAVLATALTNPHYVDDARFDMWKETYFMQMQSWRAFSERSRFVVQYREMAQSREAATLLDTPAGATTLRCNHCHLSLARCDRRNAPKRDAKTQPSVAAGIVCPKCGRHMPRCGLCKMWLGTPEPNRRNGGKNASDLENLLSRFLTFCVSCEHGFHADHARTWFEKHDVCPVPDCRCLCAVI
ncbi:hypothetical protein CERZMDRAFT_122194 [Cercospora zeae-maydis SCOH1-5]|uniref:Uncharacterized protein n=1 Tax=Cercospora zeae-maydis SCOH1-5 TaxID=717836 RepID=A0A6A6F7D4_9PEZI|nr:hypothetical protein CERZMDRAFT_122194 [Cercospora zeae-maydis SCOH1-5]